MEHPQRFSTIFEAPRKSAKFMVPQWFHNGSTMVPLAVCLPEVFPLLHFFLDAVSAFPMPCLVLQWCIRSTGVGQRPVALTVEPNGSLDLLAAHGHLVDHRAGGSLQQACWDWNVALLNVQGFQIFKNHWKNMENRSLSGDL